MVIWRLNDSGRGGNDSGKNMIITPKKCQGPKNCIIQLHEFIQSLIAIGK